MGCSFKKMGWGSGGRATSVLAFTLYLSCTSFATREGLSLSLLQWFSEQMTQVE